MKVKGFTKLKCASSPDFMDDLLCLANRFNPVFNDNFSKFCEWSLVTELLLPKFIQNLFTYAEGSVSVSPCILLKENSCLKAKLKEIKFIYRVMHSMMH